VAYNENAANLRSSYDSLVTNVAGQGTSSGLSARQLTVSGLTSAGELTRQMKEYSTNLQYQAEIASLQAQTAADSLEMQGRYALAEWTRDMPVSVSSLSGVVALAQSQQSSQAAQANAGYTTTGSSKSVPGISGQWSKSRTT
jgi:hypothetical protein